MYLHGTIRHCPSAAIKPALAFAPSFANPHRQLTPSPAPRVRWTTLCTYIHAHTYRPLNCVRTYVHHRCPLPCLDLPCLALPCLALPFAHAATLSGGPPTLSLMPASLLASQPTSQPASQPTSQPTSQPSQPVERCFACAGRGTTSQRCQSITAVSTQPVWAVAQAAMAVWISKAGLQISTRGQGLAV